MAAPQLTSRVEIIVSCKNLPDRDVMSKSDPMCVLFMKTPTSTHEFGRTECIQNTLNPQFNHKFQVDFCFEERQVVIFRLYDVDSSRAALQDHDFLGELETTVGELVSRRQYEAALTKTGSTKKSLIILTCLELQECKLIANFRVEGVKLDKKDFFGKSDPFLEIYQPMDEIQTESEVPRVRSWVLVHRTEFIKKNLNPKWAPFSIPLNRLCRGNRQLLLRFDCHDYDSDGSHDFIGSFYSSLESLEQEVARSRSAQRTLISKKKKSAGTIVFSQIGIETIDSFVDYIQGGTELHFTVAIDFTGSNGDPRDPRSLHHVSADGRPNQYELAIISVGEIVQDYDSDKQFPGLGFGALLPPMFSGVQDAFSLTLQPENPYCAGMPGLLAAYRSCIRAVRLYGPTNFSPVINHVASMAAAHQTGAQYFVLLIITDGIITDFEKTKQAIIKASSLPMSIIIVGVGDEDFSAMEELDSDDKRLRCGSMIAERDIVQFVPLRRFIQGGSIDRSRYALAKEVLAELPNQVCEWMRRRGIRAGPPKMSGPSLTSRVEISVSCRNLPDRDVTSKSDPQCVLFLRQPGTSNFQEIGRTEKLNNTLDPEFSHRFIVDFMFEERQLVKFQIYDLDSPSARLSEHDFLGELETSIGELVSRRRFETTLSKTGHKKSTIIITCFELQECKQIVSFIAEGKKLDKKDFLGKSDPYLEIYQPMEEITSENEVNKVRHWTLVHRTEVIKNNLNPRWAKFLVPLNRLCRGNRQLLLRFDCHDYDSDGSHDFIGSFYSSLESLEQEVARSRSAQRTLISKKKKSAGTIVFSQIGIETIDSFVDYIQGGTELHFTVAIDFTGSNGDPRDPRSLHHVSADGRPNQYELAIISVGEIVQDYDSDKQFPGLGFGALLPPMFSGVQDAFSLTLQPENPYCAGMPGLLAAYRSCIRAVRLYGPTNFSPVINHVASMAAAHQTGAQYFVLLIITDGIITDFEKTKQAIIKASSLPMSIIIVGVGDEDFSAMEELDSDDKRLRCGSMIAERDVVQFVPLRRFIQGGSIDRSRYALAKEVLAELPNQVCEWMRRRGIRAGPPRVRNDAPLMSGPSLTSRVEISVSCRNLPDRDVTSKSDPQCVLFLRQPGTSNFQEIGRTERLNNTLDPEFSHRFIVDFMFEERQLVKFQIYDLDSPSARLSEHDFLGELETSIGELVSRRRFETKLCRTKSSKTSIITVTCVEVQECKQVVNFQIEGHKLDKKDFLGKSDPFLEIYQPLEDVTSEDELNHVRNWSLVHRTEVIKNNLNPRWAMFSVPVARICRGNKRLILRFDCYDYDGDGSHDLIGSFYSSLESLEQEVARSRSAQRTLISKKKKSAGTIVFSQIGIETIDSFVDYIQGGTELHFTVAIDFTGSNGDPRDPRSLHHVSADGRPNQYELAIISVGEIVQDYDSDKQFPGLGFGALLPPMFSGVQDAFSLTLQPENPYCAGMPGLLAAYRSCIRAVRLYGPTNFSPVINHVASMAAAHQTGAQYFVLLIITDGIITDFEKTKQAIIKASSLPMSIIIVGVGNEDFSAMKDLDSDDKRLRCGSMIAERDVVQFVPLRRFIQGGNIDRSRYALAKEVLAELPNQVCEWMRRRGIRAGPPRVRNDAPLVLPHILVHSQVVHHILVHSQVVHHILVHNQVVDHIRLHSKVVHHI
uniref:C2 domain-containing protein n=1 Tax=Macrostomum lignano TaxID=282301 RepID=A0A1I8GKN8_9PLAT